MTVEESIYDEKIGGVRVGRVKEMLKLFDEGKLDQLTPNHVKWLSKSADSVREKVAEIETRYGEVILPVENRGTPKKATKKAKGDKSSPPKKKKEIVYVAGYSESLWKSLAVKSLRIGWPAGLEEAARHLNRGTMEVLLICGLFEDVFPAQEELKQCMSEVKLMNFYALCQRQTHHGRGLTDAFCDLEVEACSAAGFEQDGGRRREIWDAGRKWGLWLPPRSLNCFYTWINLAPSDVGIKREIDETPWRGIPRDMANGHTVEGKQQGVRVTVLSGHYENHRELGRRVMAEGWDGIRQQVHAETFDVKFPRQEALV